MTMRGMTITLVLGFALAVSYAGSAFAGAGEDVFNKKCKACHSTTDKKILGPGLAGVSKRHSDAWLHKWIMDPQGTWTANDAEAQAVKKLVGREADPNTKMKLKGMNDDDTKAVIEYIKTL